MRATQSYALQPSCLHTPPAAISERAQPNWMESARGLARLWQLQRLKADIPINKNFGKRVHPSCRAIGSKPYASRNHERTFLYNEDFLSHSMRYFSALPSIRMHLEVLFIRTCKI